MLECRAGDLKNLLNFELLLPPATKYEFLPTGSEELAVVTSNMPIIIHENVSQPTLHIHQASIPPVAMC